jgi:phosphoribosyl 1,2-cyclic phosphodiesterase
VTDQFRLQVKFWGVRGSIPTPQPENLGLGGNTTCVEVRDHDGQVLIIDGGTGLRYLGLALMREFAGQKLSLKVLMTHFHWDHIQGIPFFAPLFNPANDVTFYSDRPGGELREILEGQMSNPYFPVRFEHLAARRHFEQIAPEARFGDLTVRAFPMNHPQGACGYRIECADAVVVHANDLEHGDAKFDGILREHADGASVLIYDAQYTPEEYESKRGWGHSTWREGVRLAREANVKRLVLFHHDPGHGDRFMKDLEAEARRHFEATDAAREGSTICA